MFAPRLIILQPTPYCNINCSYCYLGDRNSRRLMSPQVVEAVREKIFSRLPGGAAPDVVWHAGEPTTAPIQWYEHAHARLSDGCLASPRFAMQSNGIAIDDRWIDLLRRTNTNISLSIDGPQRFHDQRRRTRSGKPTWGLAMRGLRRLQEAGFDPSVITVLSPGGLAAGEEYYGFYRDNGVTQISFSIDEFEGANRRSSFAGCDYKPAVSAFILNVMECAYRDGYPLHIREVERIAHILTGNAISPNEQVEPWAAVVVAADGSVSTFSPEFMEVSAPSYGDFRFGNILTDDLDEAARRPAFERCAEDVAAGVSACRSTCRYFAVCGGGSPVNKYCETGNLRGAETQFCRLSTQTCADALLAFIGRHAGAGPSDEEEIEQRQWKLARQPRPAAHWSAGAL